jgi:hypothetical protein
MNAVETPISPPSQVKWAVWCLLVTKVYHAVTSVFLNYSKISAAFAGFRPEIAVGICAGFGILVVLFWWALLHGIWLGERWANYVIQILVLTEFLTLVHFGAKGQELIPILLGVTGIMLLHSAKSKKYFQEKLLIK